MIRSELTDGIATVTIDRPERRNALDVGHDAALADALRAAADDGSVRAIVLTGVGASFCSGADLRDRLPMYQERVEAGDSPEWSFGGITGAERLRVPVVAAINGHAIAGGLELALASDIRICTLAASFSMAETRWAITPGAGGTQRLPRLVGSGVALDMLLTARSMGADEALRTGLVSRVVDENALLDEARAIAVSIAANGPLAIAAVRASVDEGLDASLAEGLEIEKRAFLATMRTADAREGASAFAQKRDTHYRGE